MTTLDPAVSTSADASATLSATLLAAGGGLSDSLMSFAPMILMVVVVYFLLLRPMSQEEKTRKGRLDTLKKGDRVVLSGGILGRISRLEDHTAMIELTDKVKVRVLRKDIVDTEEHALAKAKEGDGGGGGLFGNMLTPAGESKSDDKNSSSDAKASDGTSGKDKK